MTATTTIQRQVVAASPTRQRVMGIVFIVLGLAIWALFARGSVAGQVASYNLNLGIGTSKFTLPDWLVPVQPTLYVLAVLSAVLGGIQLARGFGRWTNLALGVVVVAFIFAFFTWAAADKSISLAGLIYNSVANAVPITLGALSGVLCERSGVVNIAIEGMMLTGALVGAVVGSITNSWLGLLAAILAGVLMALLHAVLSIRYKVNQIVSGTVINIFATGLTSYLSSKFLERYQQINFPKIFPSIPIPGLSDIPFIGPIFFNNNIFVYAMFIFIVVLQVALFKTKWGLRVRAVGEHPKAADTLGIDVIKTRYMAVLLGGAMAGFAGAYFTLGSVGRFDRLMTGGRGFIGLAAMIFGNWTPAGSFGAGLVFGFADSLAGKLALLNVAIPSYFLLMAPYIATMIVLAGVVGRGQMPAADGTPYEKEEL